MVLAHGSFKSIFDFLERVNLKSCNKKAIESFALSGALDSFTDMKREDYFQSEETINNLMEWGRKAQAGRSSLQNSLFGEEEFDHTYPQFPKAEAWSDLKRLNSEKDLIGIYLSAHPLDEYRSIIQYGCSHSIAELKSIETELKQELDTIPNNEILSARIKARQMDFCVGGIIVNTSIQTSQKGNQYGIFVLEDYTNLLHADSCHWGGTFSPCTKLFYWLYDVARLALSCFSLFGCFLSLCFGGFYPLKFFWWHRRGF